jgi:23S rRNA pseudouridine2605 synthase
MTYDASDHDENFGENLGDSPGDGERVAKALARAGVASRREVERLIEGGRVAVNGQVLTTPAVKIKPGDILTVDGEVVGDAEPTRVFRYHKPPGLLTSHSDPQGRPTVFANLPPGLPRLLSVGRLDLNSEGLLLLTNDGALSRALELPSSGWTRVYRARAFGSATQEKLDTLKKGVTVEGVKYGPIEARLDKAREGPSGRNVWITVTLTEGKNREVRRVLESLGLKVNRLIRLAYGPFALGDLGQGGVEEVGPRVIREQLEGLVPPQNMPRGDRPQFVSQGKAPGRRAPTPGKLGDAAARAAQAHATAEARPKTEYKPGWARPKPRPGGHAPSKPKGPKGPPTFERATADRRRDEVSRAANRGRTGRVLARAEDILPGASPRGPVKRPLPEPERKPDRKGPPKDRPRAAGDKPRSAERVFVNPNDNALRDAVGRGAARDAERRGPGGGGKRPPGKGDSPQGAGFKGGGPRPGPRSAPPRSGGPRPGGPSRGGPSRGGPSKGGPRR